MLLTLPVLKAQFRKPTTDKQKKELVERDFMRRNKK